MGRERYPELAMYDQENRLTLFKNDPAINIACEDDDPDAGPADGTYEVVFEAGGERYYCYLPETRNVFEALGVFFAGHPHITYDMVIDHMEV